MDSSARHPLDRNPSQTLDEKVTGLNPDYGKIIVKTTVVLMTKTSPKDGTRFNSRNVGFKKLVKGLSPMNECY